MKFLLFYFERQLLGCGQIPNCRDLPAFSSDRHRTVCCDKKIYVWCDPSNLVQAVNYLSKTDDCNLAGEKTVRRIGVKKHLRGLIDAPARNDDTAYGWMQSRFSVQPDFRFSQIMLFFTTAAHFTWLLHVHLHIITSDQLNHFRH